ncbi:MAG: hypothetical protein AB1589_00695 [Cyanobacteriota bacterium]
MAGWRVYHTGISDELGKIAREKTKVRAMYVAFASISERLGGF